MRARSSASPRISVIAACVCRLMSPGISACSASSDPAARRGSDRAPARHGKHLMDTAAADGDGVMLQHRLRRIDRDDPARLHYLVYGVDSDKWVIAGNKKALPKQGFLWLSDSPYGLGLGFASGFASGLASGFGFGFRIFGGPTIFHGHATVRRQALDQLLALHLVVAELGHRDRLLRTPCLPRRSLSDRRPC